MAKKTQTTFDAPSEALLCASCFSLLETQPFYSDAELENLHMETLSPSDITQTLNTILLSSSGIEDLFEGYLKDLRTPQTRHQSGMVFTPEQIVRTMVSQALKDRPVRIVDPGCGIGRFALRAADEARTMNHRLEIIAYDTDPLACLLLATIASIQKKDIKVIRGDFLEQSINTISGKTCFIGNPPYIRHHLLTQSQKDIGRHLAAKLKLNNWSALAGLHALFIVKCLCASKPGDTLCLLTGSEWLEVNYGKPLREAFSSDIGGGERLTVFPPDSTIFHNVMSTALVSIWKPGTNTQSVAIDLQPEGHEPSRHFSETRKSLHDKAKWSFFPGTTIRMPVVNGHAEQGLISLGELFKVSRGVATGNNAFFVLDENEASKLELTAFSMPVIARACDVPSATSSIECRNLHKRLLLPPDDMTTENDALREYILLGEEFGVPQGYVVSHRNPWWHISYRPAPLVATYMGRNRPRFALNPSGFPNLNTVHGLYPKVQLSQTQLVGIVAYLNTECLYGDSGRVYQGGLRKFEPHEMEHIRIPKSAVSIQRELHGSTRLSV